MLENALDCGIAERDFWEMTFAELDRFVESYNRRIKKEARERATFDYISAALIGRAFALTMSKDATFPELHEAYPTLFDAAAIEAERQEQRDKTSAIRFKLFVDAYNTRKRGQKSE